jgi:hypothetical protein
VESVSKIRGLVLARDSEPKRVRAKVLSAFSSESVRGPIARRLASLGIVVALSGIRFICAQENRGSWLEQPTRLRDSTGKHLDCAIRLERSEIRGISLSTVQPTGRQRASTTTQLRKPPAA